MLYGFSVGGVRTIYIRGINTPQEMLMSRSPLYLTIAFAFLLLAGCDDKKAQPSPRVEDKAKAPAVDHAANPETKSAAENLPPPRTVSPDAPPRSMTTREEATKLLA